MQTLIYGSSLLAAFLGGMLALFAPCCIVSLLPTYLAAVLRAPRWRMLELTGFFALGVALVLLPIVLGMGAVGMVLKSAHREVFFLGGLLMLGMATSTLAGKGWSLPMPMLRRPNVDQSSIAGTFFLGVFSGVVSSCCAPVLGGVLVLSAAASSLFHALGLGVSYVVGMIAPLFLAALLWDRLHLGERRLFESRRVSLTIGSQHLSWQLTDLGAGIVFTAMGELMVGLAITGQATYTPGFLLDVNRWGSDRLARLAQRAQGLPELVVGAGLVALVVGLVVLAWPHRQSTTTKRPKDRQQATPAKIADMSESDPPARVRSVAANGDSVDSHCSDRLGIQASFAALSGQRHQDLAITGMTCASCVSRIQRTIRKLNGVTRVSVSLAGERAAVTYDPARLTEAGLIAAVEAIGYGASLVDDNTMADNAEARRSVEQREGAHAEVIV